MPFTRVTSINKPDRIQAEEPDASLYKKNRFIVDVQEWSNKIVDFPLEITCSLNSKISIKNCDFKKGLILRVGGDVPIESIFICSSKISNSLKVYGSNQSYLKINNDMEVDSCLIDKVEVNQVEAGIFNIYNSNVDEINIESNSFEKFLIERSDIGFLLEYSNEISVIDIQAGSFDRYKIIPKRIFSTFKSRYPDVKDAKDASLRTVDLLLRNKNVIFPSYETSGLFYERNRIQTNSVTARTLLWMFGYFQSPMRYLTTAILLYSFIALILGVASIQSERIIPIPEILRLTFNAFIGLSYTLSDSNDYFSSLILSVAIGMGTILYSGLLVTMINRFRVKF